MEGLRVSLTPGATMLFGSLGFIYTGSTESVVGNTFTRPAHPTALTMATRHVTFICGFTGETIMTMLGPNPTHERFRLAAYYLTDLAFQASGSESRTLGRVHGAVQRHVPPRAVGPLGQPGDDLCGRAEGVLHHPGLRGGPTGSTGTLARLHTLSVRKVVPTLTSKKR
jgi:hypothetical protein